MTYKTLDDLDLAGKRVLVRVDINVPVRDGKVTDRTRMEAIRPTVGDILKKGGLPILLAHFGRPKGQPVPEMSLGQLIEPLAEDRAEIERVGEGWRRLVGRRYQGVGIEIDRQRIKHDVPGVALVPDEPRHRRQRHWLALVLWEY